MRAEARESLLTEPPVEGMTLATTVSRRTHLVLPRGNAEHFDRIMVAQSY